MKVGKMVCSGTFTVTRGIEPVGPDVVGTDDWSILSQQLESGEYGASNPVTFRGTALTPNAIVSGMQYRIDSTNTVNVSARVLGYNASIPAYVKYRGRAGDGYRHVWVSTVKNGLLAPISVGDYARTREYDSEVGGYAYSSDQLSTPITSMSRETFSYGNNCPWSVPMSVTTRDGTYEFAGYNLTFQTELLLHNGVGGSGSDQVLGTYIYFDQTDSTGRYGNASIRNILNSITGTADGSYTRDYDQFVTPFHWKSVPWKFQSEEGLLQNISDVVNRTWVHDSWRSDTGLALDANNCEHVVDRFWIMGYGNVNGGSGNIPIQGGGYYPASDDYWPDFLYDTSRFPDAFASDGSRIKGMMLSDGDRGEDDYYWLRSAFRKSSQDTNPPSASRLSVAIVSFEDGKVYPSSHGEEDFGIAPAFTIG